MSEWHTVAAATDILPGQAARVDIGDVAIAVFNVEGDFYCLDDTCSHAQASLVEGDIDVHRRAIECPLHGSAFDLRTGAVMSLPAVGPVRAHSIKVVDGELRVKLTHD